MVCPGALLSVCLCQIALKSLLATSRQREPCADDQDQHRWDAANGTNTTSSGIFRRSDHKSQVQISEDKRRDGQQGACSPIATQECPSDE